MDFVLVDESTAATAAPQYGGPLTQAALQQIAAALTVYLDRDVSTYWGGSHRVRAASSPTDIQPGEIVCAIVDSLPLEPGAVAYHDVTGGAVPLVFLARSECSSIMSGSDSISSAFSHELAEALGDPDCNRWIDDGQGHEYALEIVDAVEEWGYEINGVAVSDFLLPAFFAPTAPGPFNFLATQGGSALTEALQTAPGGYQIQRTAGSGETQVMGKLPKARKAPSRLSKRRAPS